MAGVMIGGVVFWAAVVYFGVSSTLKDPTKPLTKLLRRLRAGLPLGLVIPAVAGFGLAFHFARRQYQAVADQAGVIGGWWALAVLCAVVGAVSLAGQLHAGEE